MRRLSGKSPLALAIAAALSASISAHAQTRVNLGRIVQTSAGTINTKYRDGIDGSEAIVWAPIPGIQATDGTPYSINLAATYLTQPLPATATCTSVGAALPTGWTWTGADSCTLSYSGTGVASASGVIVRATRGIVTQDTNPAFSVVGVANIGPDSTAPTRAAGMQVVLNASNQPVIGFDSPADVRVFGQNFTDLSTFTVLRNGVPLTPTAYTGTTFVPTIVDADVGTPTGASATQNGSEWTLVSEGGHPNTGTNHAFANGTVTGDFTAYYQVNSITGSTFGSSGAGFFVRNGLDANAQLFGMHRYPSATVRSYTRTDTGLTIAQAGAVSGMTVPFWFRITRVGNELVGSVSQDGAAYSEVHRVTVAMPATVNVGATATSNEPGVPITVVARDLTITTRGRQTYTDTAGTPGSSVYTVRSADGAANVSAVSATGVTAPAAPGGGGGMSDTADYNDPVEGEILRTDRVVTNVANSAAFDTQMGDQDCNETLRLAASQTYTSNRTITVSCAADQPFIIECATPLGCTVTGAWQFGPTSKRAIVKGFLFSGTTTFYIDGDNNKLLQSRFTGWGVANNGPAVSPRNLTSGGNATGMNCEIGFVEFDHPGAWASTTVTNQNRMGVRSFDDGNANFHRGCWLHDLYFHDFPPKPVITNYGSGQNDAIEVGETEGGTYPNVPSGWYIERILVKNHFQAGNAAGVCRGPAVAAATIDMKVGGEVLRDVTFDHVCGNIDGRGTSQWGRTLESLYFVPGGPGQVASPGQVGIRGDNVRLIGSFINGDVSISAGQMSCLSPSTNVDDANGPNAYGASCNAFLAGNTVGGTTTVGARYDANDRSWTFPASNVTIRAHTGAITQKGSFCPPALTDPVTVATPCVNGFTDLRASPAGVNFVPPRKLLPAQVGPGAIGNAATLLGPGWLEARDY